ncbi:bifunctional phosphoribosylaminoimidazolecarboxamide formyltransferase/IMP cyclohydrolase [Natronorarus salvus]|uniref:bifunctional phosphoribosylaminoimidazolecarboxamide formyltransferase/IMP cyclohydrolase n=1 Tax=Natronorarus salvus TaxID=3117733 RepID=UPI002F264DB9
MTRIAGLASNRGRNLLNLVETTDAELAVLLTNRKDAPIVESAAERSIPTETVVQGEGESRREHERRVVDALSAYGFDLVCLDGYMRILTDEFLSEVPTTLNVHPSLLPAFPGADAHRQVLDASVRVTGCTVHVVTDATDSEGEIDHAKVDSGPIVTQEPVPVYEDDTEEGLKHRVLYEGEFRAYPRAVRWFAEGRVEVGSDGVRIDGDRGGRFPARRLLSGDRAADLRYGENPHQEAALYAERSDGPSVVGAEQLNEGAKALSYNNYNDADAALSLIREFDAPAAAVIKHANPAGCALGDRVAEAYDRALSTDPMSAFGGIVALNRECDRETAAAITDSFKEVVVAPGYTDDALEVLRETENLRVLDVGEFEPYDDGESPLAEKPLAGGRLVQERDGQRVASEDLEVVTDREPTDEERETMCFAWSVVKHVKSNAIVLAEGTETVGIGMGQVSRVDAVRLATMKAEEHAEGKGPAGSVMASDAFFPFPDGVEVAAEAGVEAVVQPGGSVNDEDVVAAADGEGMAMAFTGSRCFRHD